MKLTAKLLSLIIALSMVAGCGSSDKKEKTPEELVKEVATGYMDDCCDLDIKGTLDYISPDSEMYKAHSELDSDALLNELIPAEVSQMFGEENIDEIVDKMLGLMSYEIKDVKVDGDKATVDYVMNTPDFESIEMDEDKMLADLGIDNEEDLIKVMLDVLGVKDEEEAQEKLMSMTEEDSIELSKKVMEKLGLVDYVIDLLGEADTTVINGTIELEKINNEWLIVADEQ